jgi:dienelactone hydrolase
VASQHSDNCHAIPDGLAPIVGHLALTAFVALLANSWDDAVREIFVSSFKSSDSPRRSAMSIRFECSGCQKRFQVADAAAGKSLKCKECGTTTRIPRPSETDDEALFAELEEGDAAEDDFADEAESSNYGGKSLKPALGRRSSGSDAGKSNRRPKKSGGASVGKWIAIIGGSGAAVLLLCFGGGYYFLSSALKPRAASAEADEPFPVSLIRPPNFPQLGTPQNVEQKGVRMYILDLATANPGSLQPAASMKMRVYLPPGDHQPGSLGCVLVGPSGTNLLSGSSTDDPNYHKETLPYAQAGYVAIAYSLDGGVPSRSDGSNEDALVAAAYKGFSAAYAGLTNARATLEFVLARLPQVDPKRIFAAGHDSAGTLALLFAAHEPRLKGCIAYAPQTDPEAHFAATLSLMAASNNFPGVADFARRSSPRTHIGRIQCPVFLFWAADDSVVAPAGIQKFATELGSRRPDVTVKTVPTGDHYQPMYNSGIGLAIEWLKGLPGEQANARSQ